MWLLQGTRPSTLESGAHDSFSVSVKTEAGNLLSPHPIPFPPAGGNLYLKLAISLRPGPKKQLLAVFNQRNTVTGSSLGKNELGVWRQNHAVYSRNSRNDFQGIFAHLCVSPPLLALGPPPLNPRAVEDGGPAADFLWNCNNPQPFGHSGQLQLGMLSLQGLTLFLWPVWTHRRCRCDFWVSESRYRQWSAEQPAQTSSPAQPDGAGAGVKGCPPPSGPHLPHWAAPGLGSTWLVAGRSGRLPHKMLSCFHALSQKQRPFTFPPLLKVHREERRSEFRCLLIASQRSGFLLQLEVAHDTLQAWEGWIITLAFMSGLCSAHNLPLFSSAKPPGAQFDMFHFCPRVRHATNTPTPPRRKPWTKLTSFHWGAPSGPYQVWSGCFVCMNESPKLKRGPACHKRRGTEASVRVQSHFTGRSSSHRVALVHLQVPVGITDDSLNIHWPNTHFWPPTRCHTLL